MKPRIPVVGLLLVLTVVAAPRSARAELIYSIETYQHPDAGRRGTSAFDINNRGVIVGNYDNSLVPGSVWGFIRAGDTYTNFTVAGSSFVTPFDSNTAGTVIGFSSGDPANPGTHGFMRDAGGNVSLIDVPVQGVVSTTPRGIDTAGTVVGSYSDQNFRSHGFLLQDGRYSVYDIPSAANTSIFALNDIGQLAGQFNTGIGITHGFIVTGSTVTTVDFPGAVSTIIADINNVGLAAGFYRLPGQAAQGFVYDLATNSFTTIVVPGARDTRVFGINDAGVLVGDFNGASGAFTATPVPEPGTWVLFSTGGVLLGLWGRSGRTKRCT